jgi:hypothetical protein
MMTQDKLDGLIRDTLRQTATEQDPATDVRASLLAKAAAYNAESELVVGAPIPPLVNGLREVKPTLNGAVRLPALEAELMDLFGAAQQRLVSVWLLSSNSRY